MSEVTDTKTFSEFLRSPNEVLAHLQGTSGVVLTRRNAPSLRLTQESTSKAEMDTLGVVGQLFAASLDEAALSRVAERLSVPLPWIAMLPERAHAEFIAEFQAASRASIALGRFEKLAIVLEAWKSTAEAYADPHITTTGEDLEYLDTPERASVPGPAA
ncbi:hypothetical protein [Rhodococcoides fascians]|uniref:hypothetical protein n=1 Tax=Rhodococcoides fascians TaxID=1828 RepID=UPI00050BDCEB|nr:hypothetical protein [Rhodococcus fascians]